MPKTSAKSKKTPQKKIGALNLRCSETLRGAVQRAADAERTSLVDWVTRALAHALAERGISLPPDCPEYQPEEAPAATLNEALEREATALLPEARAKTRPWADAIAREEWAIIGKALQEIDDPALWNDFLQSWSIPGRTARQKLHALKFRLQAYRERLPRQGSDY
ncbi:MAG TPA: hypothetical protein PLU30_17210 [Verrucomicrobiae bacterium]|nr:hypothetical protein [Verrucomicrobiae bacterium]